MNTPKLMCFLKTYNLKMFNSTLEIFNSFENILNSNHVNSDLLKMMMKLLILSDELSLELEILCFEILFNQQILLSEEYSHKIELLKGYSF
jgi:hypothetical protein